MGVFSMCIGLFARADSSNSEGLDPARALERKPEKKWASLCGTIFGSEWIISRKVTQRLQCPSETLKWFISEETLDFENQDCSVIDSLVSTSSRQKLSSPPNLECFDNQKGKRTRKNKKQSSLLTMRNMPRKRTGWNVSNSGLALWKSERREIRSSLSEEKKFLVGNLGLDPRHTSKPKLTFSQVDTQWSPAGLTDASNPSKVANPSSASCCYRTTLKSNQSLMILFLPKPI